MEEKNSSKRSGFRDIIELNSVRYCGIFSLDAVLVFLGFMIAYYLRFEGAVPVDHKVILWRLLPWLLSARIIATLISQTHRWSFRYAGFHDGIRFIGSMVIGTLLFLSSVIIIQLPYPPRSVVALEFFLSSVMLGGYRFLPRLVMYVYLERERTKGKTIKRTIIVGAGSAGELLLRDLRRSEEHSYKVVGFVDDNTSKVGKIISGQRILGTINELPTIAKKQKISDILIAIPKLDPKKIKAILDMCQNLKLRYKVLPVSFAFLQENISSSMLKDLQPEDLLPRDSVPFEESEIQTLVKNRRSLVTGAAGSIGSEIVRQLAKYGAQTLILVDINENELYFLYRDIKEQYPHMEIFAEVADVRDREKMIGLGRKYRPHDILHAAAHKHVPLMEWAPEEAVKNNIFGTRNVADMAGECSAERFVLISTDKAVNPTSVMGVSKRIAEMIVREKGKSGPTFFSAVRFGNVLGSAGSVVPLFKRQIAKGGPLTVTHPEIKRYFMTIEEAVGLVLLAGLGKYGELCILDMGEQIKIMDLARHMISMAGLIPEQDIRIAFTGLRPGEKLQEDLMTEHEEKTQKARDKVFIVKSFLPENLDSMLSELGTCLDGGNSATLKSKLGKIVPKYNN
ncbi:MAG TPA: nucleoside-diphosphate sugar epimerase/dehydratase [Acidobacteriota bacterium]|nr:nucleoside-diphosphate sugar epimerase/dehydratase [Acidobacteriota bacterium]